MTSTEKVELQALDSKYEIIFEKIYLSEAYYRQQQKIENQFSLSGRQTTSRKLPLLPFLKTTTIRYEMIKF